MSDAFDLYMFDSPGASPGAVAAPTSSGPIGPAGAGDGVNVTSAYAQPSYDTSYLYTPTSAQPGGSEFVAPPGYQPTFGYDPVAPYQYGQDQPVSSPGSAASYYGYTPPVTPSFGTAGGGGGYVPTPIARPAGLDISAATGGAVAPAPTDEAAAPQQDKAGFFQSLLGKGFSAGDALKLALGIGGGILGYNNQQKAASDTAAAEAEYKAAAQNAASQYQTLAQPYLTAGGSQLSMALQGSLAPAQMQQFQAAQAQLAQGAERTGGVGAIQSTAALQNIYQQALQNQQNMAIQLLGPGNTLASNAIATELQGTQGGLKLGLDLATQANQASMNMYSVIAQIMGGSKLSPTGATAS